MQLRLMTFNIRYATPHDNEDYWQNRQEITYRVLRDANPDVIGLQEVLLSQRRDIEEALPSYSSVGVGRDDGDSIGEHCLILYRKERLGLLESGTFWCSDTPDVAGSTHWGNSHPRICTWVKLREKASANTFYLLNVHLDHQSQPSRLKSARLLKERLHLLTKGYPTVVMGDFNMEPDNPAIAVMTQTDTTPILYDTPHTLLPQNEPIGTFHSFQGDPQGEAIDYIFTTSEWQAHAAQIIRYHESGRYPSDHFPVLLEASLV